MSDIFISYARASQRQADLIGERLRAAGYTVWRDNALPVHRPYPEVIEEQLRAAKAVVVIWSLDAARSQWVRSEANKAIGENKLVQVSIDASLPPMPFDQVQCAELGRWDGDDTAPEWRKVLESVAELIGAQAAAAARAPSPALLDASRAVRLAVLPFDNLSGDPSFGYFSDGISEEILQAVGKIEGVTVIARTSSFQFRGADKSVRRVAADLNTSHLLDGSVRRSGDRVRISAQLIQCASQTSVWSERYDRTLSDIFALQDEIAGAVSKALELTFAPAPAAASVDAEAYDLYLRARSANPRQARAFDPDLLEAATARAPGFAAAWAALALTRAQAARAEATHDGFEPLRARAAEAAERALALDPNAGAAYVALSLLEPVCGRFAERDALIERALAAAPGDPVVLNHASAARHAVGRVREAFGYSAHAHEVDPLLPQAANRYAVMLANLGLQGECDDALDRARARWPDYDVLLHNALGFAAAAENWTRFDAIMAGASEATLGSALVQAAIREAGVQRRWTVADGEALLGDLREELARTGTISLRRLGLACAKGLAEPVFDLTGQASFEHLFEPGGRLPDGDLGLHVLFVPAFAAMRASPRFPGFCAGLGLCDYWAATGRWPDFAADVAGTYDLKTEARRSGD